jgi:hypothetical protein
MGKVLRVRVDDKSLAVGSLVWVSYWYLVFEAEIKDIEVKPFLDQVWLTLLAESLSEDNSVIEIDSRNVFVTEREAIHKCLFVCDEEETKLKKELIDIQNIKQKYKKILLNSM